MDTILGGKAELSLGVVTIPADLIGDITPSFKEGTRDIKTLGGNRTQPKGTYDESTLSFTLYVPSMDYLKNIWAGLYNPSTGTGTSGNVVFGGDSCPTQSGVTANIHYVCDANSNNDQHFFNVLVGMNWNPKVTADEGLSVEVMLYVQPTDNGYFQLGAGDLTKPTLWNPVTQTWAIIA